MSRNKAVIDAANLNLNLLKPASPSIMKSKLLRISRKGELSPMQGSIALKANPAHRRVKSENDPNVLLANDAKIRVRSKAKLNVTSELRQVSIGLDEQRTRKRSNDSKRDPSPGTVSSSDSLEKTSASGKTTCRRDNSEALRDE